MADSYFELPDFPIVKTESFLSNEDFNEDMESIDENMDKLSKLSFEEWKEMQNMSEAELRDMYDMIQNMIKMRKGE